MPRVIRFGPDVPDVLLCVGAHGTEFVNLEPLAGFTDAFLPKNRFAGRSEADGYRNCQHQRAQHKQRCRAKNDVNGTLDDALHPLHRRISELDDWHPGNRFDTGTPDDKFGEFRQHVNLHRHAFAVTENLEDSRARHRRRRNEEDVKLVLLHEG